MQGGLSSHVKRRLNVIKQVVRVMAEKIEDVGDPDFLRRKNAELNAELRLARRETAQLKRDVADLKRIVEDMKAKVSSKETPSRIFTSNKASSPMLMAAPRRGNSVMRIQEQEMQEVVMRPALGGVRIPIPDRQPMLTAKAQEDAISAQIDALKAKRKEIRQGRQEDKPIEG